ncbi:Uncharacterised protein [Mycobacteroides abscessus subsp. abscessus]|nr:Uncharacterised protein [Mycobacteroides abscessus subsp. abscessus]
MQGGGRGRVSTRGDHNGGRSQQELQTYCAGATVCCRVGAWTLTMQENIDTHRTATSAWPDRLSGHRALCGTGMRCQQAQFIAQTRLRRPVCLGGLKSLEPGLLIRFSDTSALQLRNGSITRNIYRATDW